MARKTDRMSDRSYKFMVWLFKPIDFLMPGFIDKRVSKFGIREGMNLVDYGCGPGRYTTRFARLVGEKGKVYAVDIHEIALEIVREKMVKLGLDNVEPVLAKGYDSGLPDHVADMVTAIDMFFSVHDPAAFLAELKRIAKPDGVLVIDDGHQPRAVTKAKIAAAGSWKIVQESGDHLKCTPLN